MGEICGKQTLWFSCPCRLPTDVLAGLLAWRAVLAHLLSIEDYDFGVEVEVHLGGTKPCAAHARRCCKEGVMHAVHAVLPSLGLDTDAEVPLALAQLDGAAGSGAALDDWVLTISGGADEEAEAEAVAAADATADDGDETFEAPGAVFCPLSALCLPRLPAVVW